MPLRLDIKRKLTARSDRVKSVDLHPTEPWMVVSLYSGTVVVWNHESQTMVKTFELCDLPVRVAKFVARKHWVITGADDMLIRVFNYNTLERVHMFEAHSDYIRCIAVHPTQPYILTSSDDMLIKLWDWERKWSCSQVFEGHTHYVMEIVINPKDNNQFASASLDRTIKVWQLGSKTPNFTLEGHEKGVNCIDYYSGGDKPYLISGADDRLVKIWDYQNKTCVQTLEGHAQNVTCVRFHPALPIILTGSEDGTVRVWHSNTYRLENTLNYGMERVWCICGQPGSNSVALGYDEGSIIIKLGREEPAMSMDSSGKVMWARHSEVQQANLKAMGDAEIRDGERLSLGIKDMGSCEIYPQTIEHSPNGRFVVVCGDGEYIIYTAMALRNKSFGSAQEFVWAHDSSQYSTREGNNMVKIFKNFKEKKAFKPDFGAENIFGGFLLGVRSNSGLAFYDWESSELVRRIEIQPKHIFWSDSGELCCIATSESFFVLRYLPEKVAAAQESKEQITEDGIEDAFEVQGEVSEVVKTGVWVGDCFIFTSSLNRLNYYVGGEIITIAHLDRTMYLLGYIPKDDRLYLGDKELNVISYSLLLSVLEYQTAVMRRDFNTADKVLPTIPKEQRIRVAHFLEKQGFKQQALAVSTDPEHKFELALQLGEVKIAYQLALEAESEQKWKQLAELATTKCQFSLAQECLHQAQDYGGLLLLATASGNANMVGKLAEGAEKDGKTNVAFLTYFMQGRLEKCLELLIKTDRLPEAAFLARTYLPSHVTRVVKLWKESLSKVNQKAADALADPIQYSNLFPGLQQALLAEQYLKETHVGVRPAAEYPLIMPNEDRNVLEESAKYVPKGEIPVLEDAAANVDESVMVAPVTEEIPATTAAVTEVISATVAAVTEASVPVKQESVDLVLATEESIPAAESSLPVTVTEEHIEAKQAESVSPEEDTIAALEEASVPVEEDILESIAPKEPEMVQSSLVDVGSLVEKDVQEVSAAADVCVSETSIIETTTETVLATEETENKTAATTEIIATEDLLVSTGLIEGTDRLEADKPVDEETEINTTEEPTLIDIAAEETPVTEEPVSETQPSAVATDELISFDFTDSSDLDPPVQVQTLPDLSLDPLQNLLQDTMPVMMPVSAQEPEKEDDTALLVTLKEPVVPLQAEPEVLTPAAAPAEKKEEKAGPEGAEEPAEDLEDEMVDDALDDLDLDNFDLEDIDTTDVNLDDDFLSE
ncbi:coatomer subunit beta'-like isoform X2 [Notolabrus celidotus]|uniref:coatomer subunit beta'-like isoform X2 n=1 Tax=Notolabrus celidotus TaxID=1203425 RepID=UPI00148FBC6D|nr:coatomer subunit beta'-like isoform X2 [Notolabrus celidotus]